jgi:hypothetical protein
MLKSSKISFGLYKLRRNDGVWLMHITLGCRKLQCLTVLRPNPMWRNRTILWHITAHGVSPYFEIEIEIELKLKTVLMCR